MRISDWSSDVCSSDLTGDAIVIGIGLNIAHHPEGLDRPVTSMAECGAGDVEPGYFLETLADIFARWLERWRTYGLPPVRSQWLKYAHPKGTMLKAHLPDGTAIEGTLDRKSTRLNSSH